MPQGLEADLHRWIETFRSRCRLDLHPHWWFQAADGSRRGALADPWGEKHRPDWHARGLIVWPRGGVLRRLRLDLVCPPGWEPPAGARARLVLRWWAEQAELRVDGRPIHRGDLFDTACRWSLPERWWQGETLALELRLRSPLHDDGALISSGIELEPLGEADPDGLLLATALELECLRHAAGPGAGAPSGQGLVDALAPHDPAAAEAPRRLAGALAREGTGPSGGFQVLGHAHLDLAWLWPVADTWQAAVRTFESVLGLMERHGELHFGHSTPALYAWLERHRPALYARVRRAMRQGRWEPLHGPWVETDCVLIGTASLLRQFQEGQRHSRSAFPEWDHGLAWLPDSFGFSAGLPAVAAATGVRWFCTHKLAWNATNPFPHRLFRWRARCGAEVLALMTAPIGTDGDPVAMERQRLEWQRVSGDAELLWLPGVGDHGGGPTAEMLEQLALWQASPAVAPQRHGTVRQHLARLEPLAGRLPIWRDELYLELHRGCPTSRPDQKRHNRSLERLLREADLAAALLALEGLPCDPADWRPLLFQQFHDILPGTAIPEVFEQAEPQWRQARRLASQARDRGLRAWLAAGLPAAPAAASSAEQDECWWIVQTQTHPAASLTLRLPAGDWRQQGRPLPCQPAPGGGHWVQLAFPAGVAGLALGRRRQAVAGPAAALPAITAPVRLEPLAVGEGGGQRWRLGNGLVWAQLGPSGLEQLWGADHRPLLAGPAQWCRWLDRGEFWDAWDLAGDYRERPLPLHWEAGPRAVEHGPLCGRLVWRGRCGASALRLDLQLRAGSPWLELTLSVDWRQRHELLRFELPLQQPALRWAADTPAGVLERPAAAVTARERARWEVATISWVATQSTGGGLAVLLDGPQGVSVTPERLGVSLLRAPTWPDPGADNGPQRLRLALMPCAPGWRQAGVAGAAVRFREPCWCRPAASGAEALAWNGSPPLTLGHSDLQLVALTADPRPGVARLTVQNLSPCRHRLELGDGWVVLGRIDGLGEPLSLADTELCPWQLASWRISRRGRRTDR